jgi:hypothetical protein
VPDPPLEVRSRAAPTVPYVEVSLRDACALRGAATKVTVVGAELAARYVESAALVAVTVHVPGLVASNLLLEIKQFAEPELLRTYVTAPLPEPPLVVRVSELPTVPYVEVSLRVDWAT